MQNEINEKRGTKAMPTLFAGHHFGTQKTSSEKQEQPKISKTLPLYTAEKLLENKKYQGLINQCTQLLDFTQDQKTAYLTPLMQQFVEFVQNLPETRNSYFSKPGGFIDHALMRTTSALSMCRAYFSAESTDKKSTQLGATEMLWMYTLFSAGIFNGIGKVFSDLVIELYDAEGKHLDRWNPFEGSMLETAAFSYDYDFEQARHIDLFSRRLSVLLAKQLMPFQGFAWISSNKEALSLWLALLEDNQRDAGTLGPFIVRADALAINTYFDEKRMQREYSNLDIEAKNETDKIAKEKDDNEKKQEENQEKSEAQNEDNKEKLEQKEKEKILLRFSATLNPETDKPQAGTEADKAEKRNPNTQAGIEFLKWLTNQLKAQRMDFNDSIFYMPAGAIFLPTVLFEEFRKKNPYYRSALDVIESFNRLQLQTKGSEQNDMHTFVRQSAESIKKIQGIVLGNAQLILPKTVNIRLGNGLKHEVNSSELPHYSHLLEPLQPAGKAEIPQPTRQSHGLFGR